MVDYILEEQPNTEACNKLLEQLLNDSDNSNRFIREYVERGVKLENIIGKLCKQDIFLWQKITNKEEMSKEDGETSEVDLIFITQKGIFVFESKNYSGWIFGDEKSRNWTAMLPNKQKHQFYNPKIILGIKHLPDEFVNVIKDIANNLPTVRYKDEGLTLDGCFQTIRFYKDDIVCSELIFRSEDILVLPEGKEYLSETLHNLYMNVSALIDYI